MTTSMITDREDTPLWRECYAPAMRRIAFAWLFACALLTSTPVSAQDEDEVAAHMEEEDDGPPGRPTSGDMSIFSGRTNGNGETVIAAGVGWPGIWAGIWLSPSSTFNLALLGHVYYGSPLMSFAVGVGGGLTIPFRIHVFAKDSLDISLYIEPGIVLGEAALVGEVITFAGAFGYSIYATAGVVAGAQISDTVTLNVGVLGEGGYVHTPSKTFNQASGIGGILVSGGLEALMSRDTMLFVQIRGGIGFSDNLFDSQAIFQGTLGLAYLL
jgi:hypothetical protein